MIITNENYLAEGLHRKVYIHPENPNLCVKIPKASLKQRSIDREIHYLEKYSKASPNFLSLFHGITDSNLGKGYVFDLIRNEDGAISESLTNNAHLSGLSEKLHFLYNWCLENRIIIGDLNHGNVVIKKNEHLGYDLYVIDGVGNSDYIKLCDYSDYFMKKKVLRKFTRLSASLGLNQEFG